MTLTEFLDYLNRHQSTRKWADAFTEVVGEPEPVADRPVTRARTAEQ